jgi:GT2 family glycosyltransferase
MSTAGASTERVFSDGVIGIAVLHRYDLLVRLLTSIVASGAGPYAVCVVDNGRQMPELDPDIKLPIDIVSPCYNLGTAESWNVISRRYRPRDICFVHDDIVLASDSLERLVSCRHPLVTGLSLDFALLLVKEEAWQLIGEFDGGYWPSSWHQSDFRRRAAIAGIPVHELETGAAHGDPASGTRMHPFSSEWSRRNYHYFKDTEPRAAAATHRPNATSGAIFASTLEWEYNYRCRTPSDINEHLPRLRDLAQQCNHITEFGTRAGNSTIALLAAQPQTLVCVDTSIQPALDIIKHLRCRTQVSFVEADVRSIDIAPTDLLFIDTYHTADHLNAELSRHSPHVRALIALHDTEVYGERGEDGSPGLRYGLTDFLKTHPIWKVVSHHSNNNGLTILKRRNPPSEAALKPAFVGIPILNRLDLLHRCIARIDYPSDIVVVNNNSLDLSFRAELEAMADANGFTIVHQVRNLGVSASWNLIIRIGMSKGYDRIIIGSNDTFLRPGSIEAAVVTPKSSDVAVYHLEHFNFFMVSDNTVADVGWFDENFYPAYKEDQDYVFRCELAGRRRHFIDGAGGEHVGSATIHSNPKYLHRNSVTHGQWNMDYYRRKWGGDADAEVFCRPFNDSTKDHRWWPDPGSSIDARDWDRPD